MPISPSGRPPPPGGARAFDWEIVGKRMFLDTMSVVACAADRVPEPHAGAVALGRNLSGCRIGFDLGGSDRKSAAVIDGEVVFSEEIAWDPYFQKDPQYHYEGIRDSLQRAAAKLPRVDAIGGSAAGRAATKRTLPARGRAEAARMAIKRPRVSASARRVARTR